MEVQGEVGIFEGGRACAPLRRRLLGWRVHLVWIFLPTMIGAQFLASWVGDLIVRGGGLIALLLVSVAGIILFVRINNRLLPQAWLRRGVASSERVTYRIEDDALVIVGSYMEARLAWSGLDEIAPGHRAWLFIGQGAAHFLPIHLFQFDLKAQGAFLAACLERMTPKARARSPEAARLAGA